MLAAATLFQKIVGEWFWGEVNDGLKIIFGPIFPSWGQFVGSWAASLAFVLGLFAFAFWLARKLGHPIHANAVVPPSPAATPVIQPSGTLFDRAFAMVDEIEAEYGEERWSSDIRKAIAKRREYHQIAPYLSEETFLFQHPVDDSLISGDLGAGLHPSQHFRDHVD